jgi:hypothetical protein
MQDLFTRFRPSDRAILAEVAETDPDRFVHAFQGYLQEWAYGTWIEEYTVERLARWIAHTCPEAVTLALGAHARDRLGCNDNGDGTASVYRRAYQGFLAGLQRPAAVI